MLNRYPPEEIVPALAHHKRMVNRYAALMLGMDQDDQLVPFLAALLQSGSAPARRAAATALGASAGPFTNPSRLQWADAQIDPRAVEVLTTSLRDPDVLVRANSARSLGHLAARHCNDDTPNPLRGEAAVASLIRALRDPAAEMRTQAAASLQALSVPAALPDLISLLQDADPEVRAAVAFAAGDLGAPQALPTLLDVLRHSSRQSRQQAATSLRRLGDAQVVPALMDALADPTRQVRQEAAVALGGLGDPRAVPALLNALDDVKVMAEECRGLREDLVTALKRLGDRQAVPTLVQTLKDYDKNVRGAALSALLELGGSQAEDALISLVDRKMDCDDLDARRTIRGLGRLGITRAMPILRLVIEGGHDLLAPEAARALRRLGDTITAHDMLTQLSHPLFHHRRRAVLVLRHLVDQDALPHLLHALDDPDPEVRAEAARQLGYLRDRSALPSLNVALEDDDQEVRQAAHHALDLLARLEPPLPPEA